jgi:predicted TIM-barrel fold metal-dependent hydrolase
MIIDGHSHMFAASMFSGMGIDPAKIPQQLKDMAKYTVDDNKKTWLEAMDRFGIEKTVFMGTSTLNGDFIDFINSSERFIGFAKMDPTMPNSVDLLQREFEAGMKGVKLYATEGRFDVGSKEAYPFYEYCQKNNVPIVIHFGVTIGMRSDLRTGNPLLLSKVLKDFPDLSFTIAHFGAGFFREVLMLRYKQNNLSVDTSGTNNWLTYQDNFMALKDVFKKAIEVFTPQGLVFGTDTMIFRDGYRKNILDQQIGILDDLGISQKDKEDIMYNNAKRIFKI